MNEQQEINDRLKEVYEKFKSDLIDIAAIDNSTLDKFSAPLLMNINEKYINSKIRILLVGQETCGWGDGINLYKFLKDDKATVGEITGQYDRFDFAKSLKLRGTPFWRFYKELHIKLGIGLNTHPNYIAWTNLFKFDCNRKSLSNEQKNIFKSINGELLRKEIGIIKPNMILFATGWKYDEFITKSFLNCNYKKIEPGFLARIEHECLPKNTFRTFHPHTLQLQKKFNFVFDSLISTIT